MRPNVFMPRLKLPGGPGRGAGPGMAGASLAGDQVGLAGGQGLGTETRCAAVAVAARQRRERAVIHRLPAR